MSTPERLQGNRERRAAAERDGLRELFAVFTHDLSNPLQSLTVLCELALSETESDAEQRERASQCLEATQRMNALVLAVSKVTRGDGPRHVRGILDRILLLFARRFDRYDVTVKVDTSAIDDVIPPPDVENAVLNLMLAAIARFTKERRRSAYALTVRGTRPSPALHPTRCTLELLLAVPEDDGSQRRLTLFAEHCSRIDDLVAEDSAVTFEHTGDLARLSFDGSAG